MKIFKTTGFNPMVLIWRNYVGLSIFITAYVLYYYRGGNMIYSATKLRQNLYNLLDSVIETGRPIVIERKGTILKIVPEKKPDLWDLLEHHDVINGDPDSIVSIDWTDEWSGEPDL
jgi:hypothetical protein